MSSLKITLNGSFNISIPHTGDVTLLPKMSGADLYAFIHDVFVSSLQDISLKAQLFIVFDPLMNMLKTEQEINSTKLTQLISVFKAHGANNNIPTELMDGLEAQILQWSSNFSI